MYRSFLLFFIFLSIRLAGYGQQQITGIVTDSKGQPVEGANIYITGTLDGASSDKAGNFRFTTSQNGTVTLGASYIGYKDFRLTAPVTVMAHLIIKLQTREKALEEVVVRASTFSLGKSRTLEKLDALDVVMTGSSNGDIYGALISLPGTQKVGEDGKLYIRGGDNRETQTFVDGMHVLSPYSVTAQDMPSRGRFSPFLFQGINFSLGGYESEFGQALSAVLPMDTKDVAGSNKAGVNFSPLNAGGGGSLAFRKSSLSGNVNFTDLTLYNKVLPDRYAWKKPYQSLAAEAQYKTAIGPRGIFKLYTAYDRTAFARTFADTLNEVPERDFRLHQDNYYLNATLKTKTPRNTHLFFGVAGSYVDNRYDNARFQRDSYRQNEQELHLKTKLEKSLLPGYRLSGGMEAYLRGYRAIYHDTLQQQLQDQQVNYQLYALFADNQVRLLPGLYANASGRLEYAQFSRSWNFSPRLSLNYLADHFQVSAIYGRYYQMPDNSVLAAPNEDMRQSLATHYILGASYEHKGRLIKAETYYKQYDRLELLQQEVYHANGYGKSAGFDVYFSDETTVPRLKYNVSYSYNDAQRLYRDFPVMSTPLFASRHNARLSGKYHFPLLKAYAGITATYASGRPYRDPNRDGYINAVDKDYFSLDANLTFLISRQVILYTSCGNITGRQNTYGYRYAPAPDSKGVYQGAPVMASRNNFFFVGVFISLKSSAAYDVSSF